MKLLLFFLLSPMVHSQLLVHTSDTNHIYIVSFNTPPVSSRQQTKSTTKQLQFIKQQHQQTLTKLKTYTKSTHQFIYEYTHAINAISLSLNDDQVKFLLQQDNIRAITPQVFLRPATDATGSMVNATQIWDGNAISPISGNKGEDIVIGILDTGINMAHESFSDSVQDGYDFSAHNPNGVNNYLGWCNPTHPNYDISYVCNNKLIGAWDFVDVFGNESDGPEDNNIHGSWMSGIAAGNNTAAPMGGFVSSFGSFVLDAPFISGIAPHAHIIMYDVCDSSGICPGAAILAAIDQAIIDGVDVLNMSLDGGLQPWKTNSIALALLNASQFGILSSTAAGNATSALPTTLGRVNNTAPWVITSANSFHGRTRSNDISVLNPMPIPTFLLNIYANLADGITMLSDLMAKIVYSKDVNTTNEEGCLAWNINDFSNAIALIRSGVCANALKVLNAESAGALGVVIFNAGSDIPTIMTGITSTIPVLMIGFNDANNMINHIQTHVGIDTIIEILAETKYKIVNALGFTLYHSSLRGPNIAFDITKPDISSPGTNIFAAIADLGLPTPQYLLGTGTSQSTAVTSGAIALLKSLKPNWTPAELKSVLMLTARGGIKFENQSPTNIDDVGSGLIDIAAAANTILVLHESPTQFINANPANGGKPSQLNIASMRKNACVISCNWNRTFTNTDTVAHSWNISVENDIDSEIIVSNSQITILPNQSQSININFKQVSGNSNEYRYGNIILSDVNGIMPQLKMTVVVYLDHLVFSNGFE